LLKAVRAGDRKALARFRYGHLRCANSPDDVIRQDAQLSDAQWVIAREYGLRVAAAQAAYRGSRLSCQTVPAVRDRSRLLSWPPTQPLAPDFFVPDHMVLPPGVSLKSKA
jgi:hypothetical protein